MENTQPSKDSEYFTPPNVPLFEDTNPNSNTILHTPTSVPSVTNTEYTSNESKGNILIHSCEQQMATQPETDLPPPEITEIPTLNSVAETSDLVQQTSLTSDLSHANNPSTELRPEESVIKHDSLMKHDKDVGTSSSEKEVKQIEEKDTETYSFLAPIIQLWTQSKPKETYSVSFPLKNINPKKTPNYIRTTKYTILTFVPLNLYYQVRVLCRSSI